MKSVIWIFSVLFVFACGKGTQDPLEQAKSQVDAKKYKQAIALYRKNIRNAKDLEEVWFSKYMLGVCHENIGEWKASASWYLDAYQTDPTRPEPLQKLSSHYSKEGVNELTYIFAKCGSFVSPKEGRFKDPEYVDYKFDEALSISSYYTRFRDDGFKAANKLLLKKEVPRHVKGLAFNNILFYVQNLPNVRFKEIEINPPKKEGSSECYFPMNPSICKVQNGYQVICRTVNYQKQALRNASTAEDGVCRTRNFLIEYTKDFIPISHLEIEDILRDKESAYSCQYQGMEDCRLFPYRGSSWFTCTIPAEISYMALCRLSDGENGGKGSIESFTPLLGPDPLRSEKNWLPFKMDGKLHLLYSSDPFTVYQPELSTGNCTPIFKYDPVYDFSQFRGSAAPILFNEGYLMIIHEVNSRQDGSRVYTHRFVFLDEHFQIEKISMPFTFKHQGVEFCCGMTLNHAEDELIMTIGIEDAQAWFVFMGVGDVCNLLQKVETHV